MLSVTNRRSPHFAQWINLAHILRHRERKKVWRVEPNTSSWQRLKQQYRNIWPGILWICRNILCKKPHFWLWKPFRTTAVNRIFGQVKIFDWSDSLPWITVNGQMNRTNLGTSYHESCLMCLHFTITTLGDAWTKTFSANQREKTPTCQILDLQNLKAACLQTFASSCWRQKTFSDNKYTGCQIIILYVDMPWLPKPPKKTNTFQLVGGFNPFEKYYI